MLSQAIDIVGGEIGGELEKLLWEYETGGCEEAVCVCVCVCVCVQAKCACERNN